MSEVAAFFSKYKDALIGIGWGIAVLGWLVSNGQANAREKRKETRTEIDAIAKAAVELVAKLRKYYSLSPEDPEDDLRSAEIAFEMKRLLVRTERLNRRVWNFKDAMLACGDLFDRCTEEPFASKNRVVLGPGSSVIKDIESSVHNLIDKLEEGFSEAFVHNFFDWVEHYLSFFSRFRFWNR